MKSALITGASGGIGLELARVFAADGWDLILTARSAERLQSAKTDLETRHRIRVDTLTADLSVSGNALKLSEAIEARSLRVDALVNNAGVGNFGPFSESDLTSVTEMIQLNIVALTQLTHCLLRPMIARGDGYILNVASTAAFQPGPLMAVYYASKAYVLSFSEAIREELRDSGVSVTALCPGATVTGFQHAARMGRSKLFRSHAMAADRVAEEGYRGMMARKSLVITGLKNKVMAASVRLAPRSLVPKVVRRIQEVDKHRP